MSSKQVHANFILPHGKRVARKYVEPTADEVSPVLAGEPSFTCDPANPLPVRYSKTGVAARQFGTVPQLLERVASGVLANTNAFAAEKPGYPKDKIGEWDFTTWAEYKKQVRTFARALIGVGHEENQGVAICGFNGPYWFVAHMGTTYAKGLSAGTYTTNTPEACKFVANHSKAHVVVVDNLKTLQKYISGGEGLDTVKHIIVAQEAIPADLMEKHGANDFLLSWEDFLAKANDVPEEKLELRLQSQGPETCATLIYTSGTTGNPKAVMSSHDSMQFAAVTILDSSAGKAWKEQDGGCMISYLPLSHIAAQAIDIIAPLFLVNEWGKPQTVYFARPDVLKGSLPITMKAVQPVFFFGVPRVWEKFVEAIKKAAKENPTTGLKAKLLNFSKNAGLQCSLNRQCGGNGEIPTGYAVAEKTIFSAVRKKLGFEKCVFFLTGAAPTSMETLKFFASLGIDILEVYGMSETAGCGAVGAPDRFKFGSCGAPLDGQEMRLDHVEGRDKAGEGEICYRGRHVMMGYLHNEEKTKEAIDPEGWLHSGDVGKFDEHHQLSITGRIKELIIGAGGENIAPIPIEDELKRLCPAISNAVMIGDQRKYNTILVTLKAKPNLETGEFHDELDGAAAEVDAEVKTVTAAIASATYNKHIEDCIKKYNSGTVCVSNAQKLQKFAILPTDLSVPGGELTGTLKIKRQEVTKKYAEQIEKLYEGSA